MFLQIQHSKSAITSVTTSQPSSSEALREITNVTNTHAVTHENQLEALQHKACNAVTPEKILQSIAKNNPNYLGVDYASYV